MKLKFKTTFERS